MKIIKLFIFSLLCLASINVYAEDKNFVFRLDRPSMTEGQTQSLYLDFTDISDLTRPELDMPRGLELRYRGPSSQISIINGRTRRSISHSYVLIARKAGTYILGPLEFNYKGDRYVSNSLELVVKSRADAAADNKDQLSDYVFVELSSSKNKIYEQEKFKINVDLLFQKLDLRNLQFPSLEERDFIIEDFEQPQQDTILVNGVRFNRVRFQANAKATSSGILKLGPVMLQVDMLVASKRRSRFGSGFGGFDSVFDDFFNSGTLETLYLSSESLEMQVMPLPKTDAVANVLVGEFDLNFELDSHKIKAGDPINFSVEISGNGDLEKIKSLDLDLEEDLFKVYDAQISQTENTRHFDYVIIPKKEGIYQIKSPRIKVFDTIKGAYSFIEDETVELVVDKSDVQERSVMLSNPSQVQPEDTEEIDYAEDIIYIKEQVKNWYKKKQVIESLPLIWVFLPIVLFALSYLPYRHKQMMQGDRDYIAKKRAPRVAREGLRLMQQSIEREDVLSFYDSMFRTMQKYIAYKLHCNSSSVDQLSVEKLKTIYGEESVTLVRELFDSCDMARYAASSISKEKMMQDYDNLKRFLAI